MSKILNRKPRQPSRLTRPNAAQSLDPTLTRKGLLAHPGSLLFAVCGTLFGAYIFNIGGVQTALDGFFSGLDHAAKSHNDEVATLVIAALPCIGVGLVALLALILFSGMSRGAKKMKKRRRLVKRDCVTLQEFSQSAAEHGISPKVAAEAYDLLLPHYQNKMRVSLSDNLAGLLHLKPVAISDLYANLLSRSNRMRTVGDDGGTLQSVLDLLVAVERCEVRSLTRSRLHRRAAQNAEAILPRPVARRRSSLIESLKRSMMRKAAVPKPRDEMMVKPRRLEMREQDMPQRTTPTPAESPVTP